ncbi:hypothetical protein [Flavivirga rizhaonensis]|uniref:Uncharacterized protein n=1 Tax=Flavivirga rizhaonensis TaxID=2559571 RepID=A0A4S1DTM8_9FLAO|nr:hypothetical protein [Flavivirga rizhaonensis]TGV01153.1 hypothetical protein EM932_16900 [Flavivirga rizhaonensis]
MMNFYFFKKQSVKTTIIKKCTLLVFASFLFLYSNSFAQLGVQEKKIDEIVLIKEKPLLVVLSGEESELAKNGFNEDFKNAINAVWKFSPSIEFISSQEYIDLSKDESRNSVYAVLDFVTSSLINNVPGYSFVIGMVNKRVFPHYIKVYTVEGKRLSYGDIFSSLQYLQNDLNNALLEDRKAYKKKRNNMFRYLPIKLVENKTLLLDESFATEELKKEIDNIYDFDFKIVNKDVIDRAIVNKNDNIIYFKKVINAPRPTTRSSLGAIKDGSRHDNGMLKRHKDEIKGTALDAMYFNSIIDAGSGKLIFFGRPSFKDKKIDIKDFKMLKKVIK